MISVAVLLTAVIPGLAAAVPLEPVAFESAKDNGPKDGVFDEFSTSKNVVNNGFTERRIAVEFDLDALPVGSLAAATLRIPVSIFNEGTKQLELHAYPASGEIELSDFSVDQLVAAWSQPDTGTSSFLLELDVTSEVQIAKSAGRFAGFSLREIDTGENNNVSPGLPILDVTVMDIAFVGSVEDTGGSTEVADWLTPSTPKSFDLDGDGVYGSYGRINFHDAIQGNMIFEDSGSQFGRIEYKDADDADAPAGKEDVGIAVADLADDVAYRFRVTGLTGSDNVLRMGIMQNVLGPAEDAADTDKTVTVRRADSASGLSFPLGTGGAVPGNGSLDMYFVDLANVSNNDEYEIAVTDNTAPFQQGYAGAVSLDRFQGQIFSPPALSRDIPDNTSGGVQHTIAVPILPPEYRILGVSIAVDHTFAGDLTVVLEGPDETTTVTLVDRAGGAVDLTSLRPITFTREVAGGIPAADMGLAEVGATLGEQGPSSFVAEEPLATFDDLAPTGDWTLRIRDSAAADTGTLESWVLQIPEPGVPTLQLTALAALFAVRRGAARPWALRNSVLRLNRRHHVDMIYGQMSLQDLALFRRAS